MHVILLLSALATTVFIADARFERVTPPTYVNRPTMPPQYRYRLRREANPDSQNHGSITAKVNKPMSDPERRPTYNFDYQHNIWQSKNGQLSAGGGLQQLPNQHWDPQMGVRGIWRFKREANPQKNGSFHTLPYGIDYQHSIWKGNNGQGSVSGGFQNPPGQGFLTHVGVQGSWNHGPSTFSGSVVKPLNGPEVRPSYNIDYQHNIWKGKNGQISAGVGSNILLGQRWEPYAGVKATFG